MALSLDPKLPLVSSADWAKRLTRRLTELFREWASKINPWIGPSWEDLRFPAQGINPLGAPSPASLDATTYPGTLLFSGSAENHIAGVAQMPHSWLEGSAIRPHVHWAKTVADTDGLAVSWEFAYAVSPINDVATAYSSWTAGTLVTGSLKAAEHHCITSFGEVPLTGRMGSTIVLWRVRRKGNTDEYNETSRLLEFDFHYQIGQVGSSNKAEYPSAGDVPLGVAASPAVLALVTAGTANVQHPLQAMPATLAAIGVKATVEGSPVVLAAGTATIQLAGVEARVEQVDT